MKQLSQQGSCVGPEMPGGPFCGRVCQLKTILRFYVPFPLNSLREYAENFPEAMCDDITALVFNGIGTCKFWCLENVSL